MDSLIPANPAEKSSVITFPILVDMKELGGGLSRSTAFTAACNVENQTSVPPPEGPSQTRMPAIWAAAERLSNTNRACARIIRNAGPGDEMVTLAAGPLMLTAGTTRIGTMTF